MKDFDLTALNLLKSVDIFPKELKTQLNRITITKGVTDIRFLAKNNHLHSNLNLNNVNFTYTIEEGEKKEKVDIPVKLINGQIILKNAQLT